MRCVCGKKIGPDPRNFNQRVSLGRNDLLIRTFPNYFAALEARRDKRRYLLLAWVVMTILLNFIHLGGG
ncbi:hypothetical protein [Klebsiella pneumoniae]|uniref:hypothetical protein n=1 Tax=Klebsiella pneumoniae TaxID=573 RepID=UPI003B52E62A